MLAAIDNEWKVGGSRGVSFDASSRKLESSLALIICTYEKGSCDG